MGGDGITTGVAIVGTSLWMADKVFGPSFEGLGNQVKIFASDRWSKIFDRAEKIDGKKERTGLHPAFVLEFLKQSAISEDDELLTELWAGLLSSTDSNELSKSIIFCGILSQIGAREARFLAGLQIRPSAEFFQMQVEGRRQFQSKIDSSYEKFRDDYESVGGVIQSIMDSKLDFVGSVYSVTLNYCPDGKNYKSRSVSRIGGEHLEMLDALGRQRLLEFSSFRPSKSIFQDRIDAVELTPLGNRLLAVCSAKVREI